MKTKLTKDDISRHTRSIDLGDGFTLSVTTQRDENADAPWDQSDGHGPVTEWVSRPKKAGELVLSADGRRYRYYDAAEATKIAKRDGWDAEPVGTGTKGEQAARAVAADFEFLRSWCADEWEYVGVIVKLLDSDGEEIASDSLWSVESRGDYWREVAAEMANTLIAAQLAELTERAHWEARDTVTTK